MSTSSTWRVRVTAPGSKEVQWLLLPVSGTLSQPSAWYDLFRPHGWIMSDQRRLTTTSDLTRYAPAPTVPPKELTIGGIYEAHKEEKESLQVFLARVELMLWTDGD